MFSCFRDQIRGINCFFLLKACPQLVAYQVQEIERLAVINPEPTKSQILMAGGKIRGGQVVGQSDDSAAGPANDAISPSDVAASFYHNLGIEGKKPKEIQAAAEAAMGLNADQTKVFKETEGLLGKVRVEIGKLLTPEQLAKLPNHAQNSFKEKTGNRKNNK